MAAERPQRLEAGLSEGDRADGALQAGQRPTFDLLPVPASVSRLPDGALVEVNRAFEQAYGIPSAEAIGKTSPGSAPPPSVPPR